MIGNRSKSPGTKYPNQNIQTKIYTAEYTFILQALYKQYLFTTFIIYVM